MRRYRPTRPEDGKLRTFRRFLFLPLKLNDQTRWLEFAEIEYKYTRCSYDEDIGWQPTRFVSP